MANLFQRLDEYQRSGVYPFHMPGHKRQFSVETYDGGEPGLQNVSLPYDIDITEIEGFDNLTAPRRGEILWQMCEEARELYGTEAVFPLINGSTAGLMAAISAVAAPGDEIIIARNCHKAVYRTAELLGLTLTYIYPEYDEESMIVTEINVEKLEKLLEQHQTAKCIVVTSPNYEGVILDINRIARVAHACKMPLIVDEAHGAHLPFLSDKLMNIENNISSTSNKRKGRGGYSALYQEADIVVQSLHKTLPALTQTAVLHVTRGAEERAGISIKRVESYVHLFQSTSPSYPLLASIDACFGACSRMVEEKTFDRYLIRLNTEREKYRKLKYLRLLDKELAGGYGYDNGKLVFLTVGTNMNGMELVRRLREEYRLELEMGTEQYAIAMTSVCDSEEGLERLREAIFAIDEGLSRELFYEKRGVGEEEVPVAVMTIREAKEKSMVMVSLKEIKDKIIKAGSFSPLQPKKHFPPLYISADYIMCYPPGVPFLVPGESINMAVLAKIEEAIRSGQAVLGVEEGRIAVLE